MHLELQLPLTGVGARAPDALPQVAAVLRAHGVTAKPLFRRPATPEMASYYVVQIGDAADAKVLHSELLATGELRGAYVVGDAGPAATAGR